MDVRDWQQLEDAMLAGQVARPARQSALRNPSSGSVGTPQSHGRHLLGHGPWAMAVGDGEICAVLGNS